MARRGGGIPCLFGADVFNDRFFVFRIFLFGGSVRLKLEMLGCGLDMAFPESISPPSPVGDVVLEESYGERGSIEFGDSGEELGDGSVRDESTVEMVVVGDESVDSVLKVEAEFRRRMYVWGKLGP